MTRTPQVKRKLSAEDRRQAIIEAAIPLFASVGFRGTTTKVLAEQAGISEALLYQHFASKESLYEVVQDHCCRAPERLRAIIGNLVPSTESLVLLCYFLAKLVTEDISLRGGDNLFPRLMINSMMEDGTFARLHIERTVTRILAIMTSCFAAARTQGDLLADDIPDDLRFWLLHYMHLGLHFNNLPTPPIVSHPVGCRTTQSLATFGLRGLGLTPQALDKHLDFDRLEAVVATWLQE